MGTGEFTTGGDNPAIDFPPIQGGVEILLADFAKKLELLSAISSSNSYASFVFSRLPACTITPQYTLKHEPIVNLVG